MSVQVEIMEELSELCGIDRIGVLSPEAPYSLSFAGGKEIKKYLNGVALQTMNVQILGRDGNQRAVAEKLGDICGKLPLIPSAGLPKSEGWQIRNISVGTPPSLKGFGTDGVYFYACVLKIDYYCKWR